MTVEVNGGDYFNAERGAVVLLFNFSAYVDLSPIFAVYTDADGTDYFMIQTRITDELRCNWVVNGSSQAYTLPTDGAGVNTGTHYVVAMYDSTANTMSISVFTTGGVQEGSTGEWAGAMDALPLDESTIVVGDVLAGTNIGKWDKIVIFDGSVTRTAQQYVDIVRSNASCPK